MRKVLGALVVALSLLSSAAAAQLVNSFQFVPVVTKATGVNSTSWLSDLTITNLGTANVKFGLKYFPENVANSFDGTFPFTGWIAPGQTMLVSDVLGSIFPSYVPGKGFLVVADVTPANCSVSSPPTSFTGLLAVSSRTYNTGDPKGTYSTAADPNLTGVNFTTFPSIIPGVRHTGTTAPGFRTNLSVANFSTVRIRVLVKILNASNQVAAPESLQTIEALSFKQWSFANLGVANLGAGAGRVEVRLDPALVADPCASVTNSACSNPCDAAKCPTKYALPNQPAFYAYASTTDNGTGDGTILSPVIDWQGYNKWFSDYQDQHCPDIKVYNSNRLTDWLKGRGFIGSDAPPTFRKVTKK